jgi:hypothetical protein
MSWATPYIQALKEKEQVEFRPRGNSMEPLVKDNQLVKVQRVDENTPIKYGDIVLCVVSGRQYLHLVKAINGDRYLIGNNRGGLNGWTNRKRIYGVLVK